jgi:hypothetical protein
MAFFISRVNDSFPKCLSTVRSEAVILGREQHFGIFAFKGGIWTERNLNMN